jgi:hypothetical protein
MWRGQGPSASSALTLPPTDNDRREPDNSGQKTRPGDRVSRLKGPPPAPTGPLGGGDFFPYPAPGGRPGGG